MVNTPATATKNPISVPGISLSGINLNIDKSKNPSNETEELPDFKAGNNPVDFDTALSNYSKYLDSRQKRSLGSAIKLAKISRDENKVTLHITGKQNVIALEEERTAMNRFFIEQTKNYELVVDIAHAEEVDNGPGLYSAKEKFEDMVKTNPAILDLKDKFGLELLF